MNDSLIPEKPPELSEEHGGLINWLRKKMRHNKNDNGVREAIEELLIENESGFSRDLKKEANSLDKREKDLIVNVLGLAKLRAVDVMIPRVDIIAIDVNTSQKDLIALLGERPHNRIPVYRDTLDEIIGAITIKDVLACLAENRPINIPEMARDVMIVSPALPVLDLMLEMQRSRKHMAMVVDEFGGIDGLVTIGDIVEAIVGELDDEHDLDETPRLAQRADGSIIADARVDLEDFEEKFGVFLDEDEREDIDTLGGLAMAIAGHLPTRGELLRHNPSGLEMEVLDADPRRVKKLKIHKLPEIDANDES